MEEVIAVTLSYYFSSDHSFPGLVACANSGIEVPEEDKFPGVAEITESRST